MSGKKEAGKGRRGGQGKELRGGEGSSHLLYQLWYNLSKLLAEQRAWEFSKEKDLDLVVLNPGLILGRPLQELENLDVGTQTVLDILTGQDFYLNGTSFGLVDVRDVAEAHILAFEVATASGRYICEERVVNCPTLLEILQNIISGHALASKSVNNLLLPSPIYKVSTQKLQEIGLTFRATEESLKEVVAYLLERGLLPQI